MPPYSQDERPLQIETALGPDEVFLTRLEGEEAVSRPFRFELDLVSPRMGLDTAALLRTPAVVTFPLHDGTPRTIHGLLSRVAQTGRSADLAHYRAQLVAWPSFLALRRHRRIFQNQGILEVAEEVFRFWGFADFEIRCDPRPTREFVVQYDETDLAFISRWLETEGIHYYFTHSAERHVMVLAEGSGTPEPCPDISEAWIRSDTGLDTDVITTLRREHRLHVGRVTVSAYDPLQPSHSLEASLEGDGIGEIHDCADTYTSRDDAERYARYRLEAEEVRRLQVEGEGDCRWMLSGHTFELQGHFNPATDGRYFITSVTHHIGAGDLRSGGTGELDYRNSFRCIPADVPYRPPRAHPRPSVLGTQSAIVVGPEGEEIWTDRLGRAKIHFHWDRDGERDENSSCWVRVSTPWGSKGFGSLSLPRIGDEVLVSFLEGDPDRPVIVGSVYNAERMPPFELPAKQTQAGLRSRSFKGGREKFSEIRFDDKPGEERLVIHAERDHHVEVENNEYHTVEGTALINFGGVKIKAGNLGAAGGDGDDEGPKPNPDYTYVGYTVDYGDEYDARAKKYRVRYDDAAGAYGIYNGAYGMYNGAYGMYTAVYGNYHAAYGFYMAAYGFHQSIYGVKYEAIDGKKLENNFFHYANEGLAVLCYGLSLISAESLIMP